MEDNEANRNSEVFSFVEPPSPFPANLVFGDAALLTHFGSGPTCGIGAGGGAKIKKIWDALGSRSRRSSERLKELIKSKDGEGEELEEEWEDILDEACYLDCPLPHSHSFNHPSKQSEKLDILTALPPELALHVLSLPLIDISTILAARQVSRAWYTLTSDEGVWRSLFYKRKGWRVKPSYLTSFSHIPWRSLYKHRSRLERRWSDQTFQPDKRVLTGHKDAVYCVEYLPHLSSSSPTPNVLITGSRDHTILIWDMSPPIPKQRQDEQQVEEKPLLNLRGHRGSVLCLQFDDSGLMVSGSSDCCVAVWDLGWSREPLTPSSGNIPKNVRFEVGQYTFYRPPRIMRVIKDHTHGVLDLRISDKWIASCSKDSTINIYSRSSLQHVCTLRGHDGPVNSIGLQGNLVVSASGDGRMILWDISPKAWPEGRKLQVYEGHEKGLACVEFKGDMIISGSNDKLIKVWSVSSTKCLATLKGHSSLVRALSYDPAMGRVVSASYDRSVRVWNISDYLDPKGTQPAGDEGDGKEMVLRGYHNSHIFGVGADAGRIVSSSHDRNVIILEFVSVLEDMFY